ncbi:MAG: hypothetical protein H6983_17450 [Ectothiorhodospiraceae bacterium]|nr:hypothetical protein [Chromatiales bacterium]MCP5155961.1 hypothetical protein [Ectothiorhodospiraceae bacterium]
MALTVLQSFVDPNPTVSRIVRRSLPFAWYQRMKAARWERGGRPIPPPSAVKNAAIRDYARRFRVDTLVETGTFYGAMILENADHFTRIFTVELDPDLHHRACTLFAPFPHVTPLQGDSGEVVDDILEALDEPALFWLDAHYSGRGTAHGSLSTPIEREIEAILRHRVAGHVILVDDAHDFGRLRDYPTLDALRERVLSIRSDRVVTVDADIVRIHRADDPATGDQA